MTEVVALITMVGVVLLLVLTIIWSVVLFNNYMSLHSLFRASDYAAEPNATQTAPSAPSQRRSRRRVGTPPGEGR
jgi:hypothetical protein